MEEKDDGPKPAGRRGFGSDAMRKRAFDLKVKNAIEQKTLARQKLVVELEVLQVEKRRIAVREREIKAKLDVETLKVLKIQRRAEIIEERRGNLCPSCHLEHFQSPPDECWLRIHEATEDKRKAFNEYLKKNKWGVLF
jgi:hypothetical protein